MSRSLPAAAAREKNVRATLYFAFFSTLLFSIIQWNLFDAYLSVLAKARGHTLLNSWVGFAESICGVTSLIFAIPVGYIVDRYCRVSLLKVAGVLGLIAASVSAFAFLHDAVIPLYANLVIWGVFGDLAGSATEALFADSTTPGSRAGLFAFKGVLERLALSAGPGAMIILFLSVGNNWTLEQLHIPLVSGCVVAVPACAVLFFGYRVVRTRRNSPLMEPFLATGTGRRRTVSSLASPRLRASSDDIFTDCRDVNIEPDREDVEDAFFENLSMRHRMIPYVVALSDFIRKIGAGMTVKFFGLFFINDYGFKPIHLSLLFCAYPLCMTVFMHALRLLTKPLGRTMACIVFQIAGISFLVGMFVARDVKVLVAFFLIRGSFQNSVYPIDRSVLMDFVPSKRRGMWNAVESITGITWSGSAVIGGFLSDSKDYRFTFLITAGVYAVALAVYLPLMWLVPRDEEDVAKLHADAARKAPLREASGESATFDAVMVDDDRSPL